jgi:type IV secretory pathway VirB3-like protein
MSKHPDRRSKTNWNKFVLWFIHEVKYIISASDVNFFKLTITVIKFDGFFCLHRTVWARSQTSEPVNQMSTSSLLHLLV